MNLLKMIHFIHVFFFIHGSLAIICWIILGFIWFYWKFGSKYHKKMGKILFCCLLITELNGMYLCYHVSSMAIPAIGISQFISTINGFTFKTFTINRIYYILLISLFNLILLIYACLNENNIEFLIFLIQFVFGELI